MAEKHGIPIMTLRDKRRLWSAINHHRVAEGTDQTIAIEDVERAVSAIVANALYRALEYAYPAPTIPPRPKE